MEIVFRDKDSVVVLFPNREFSKIMTLLTINHSRDPVLDKMLQQGLKQIFPKTGQKKDGVQKSSENKKSMTARGKSETGTGKKIKGPIL